ncbi:MAG: glyoxylase I family protein [Candidatus Latescibacterota bacterium]|jgi:glyoxylase I family protein
MIFEHFAINVQDPVVVANWYVEHLEMKVVRQGEAPAHMHFLADSTGRVVIELYNNPPELIPDYAAQDPQVLHMAFAVEDMEGTIARLELAGGQLVGGPGKTPAGDTLAMMRDPWGFSIQLVQRVESMV